MIGKIAAGRASYACLCSALIVVATTFGITGRACTNSFSVGAGIYWLTMYFSFGTLYMLGAIVLLGLLLYLFFGRLAVETSPEARRLANLVIFAAPVLTFLLAAAFTRANQPCIYM